MTDPRRGWLGVAPAALLVAAGCSAPEAGTAIAVEIWSDLKPADMDTVVLEVGREQRIPFTIGDKNEGGKHAFPILAALIPEAGQSGSFSVTAVGRKGGQAGAELVRQDAIVSFVPGVQLVLKLFLERACEGVTCADRPTHTCSGGLCQLPKNRQELGRYTGGGSARAQPDALVSAVDPATAEPAPESPPELPRDAGAGEPTPDQPVDVPAPDARGDAGPDVGSDGGDDGPQVSDAVDAGLDVVDGPAELTCPPPPCTSGDRRCGASGIEVCIVMDGCAKWGPTTPCPGRQTCAGASPTAACQCPAGPAECNGMVGSLCAGPMMIETCASDAQGCFFKIAPIACPVGKPCTGAFPNASCSCPSAPPICMGATGTFCNGATGGVVTCSRDASGCLVSSEGVCPAGKPCAGPGGAASCQCPAVAACDAGNEANGSYCSGSDVITCAADGNGCQQAMLTSCPAGKPCAGVHPGAQCTCPPPPPLCGGATGTFCNGATGGVVTCSRDASGCLVSSEGVCPAGKPCAGPGGAASCQCPAVAACDAGNEANGSYCSGSDVITCAADGNGCQQATLTSCPAGKPCAGVHPGAQCTCPPPPASCVVGGSFVEGTICASPTQTALCSYDGTSGCPRVSAPTSCAPPRQCAGAAGSASCQCPVVTACDAANEMNGSYCSGSTLVTCASNNGCQQASTTSCAMLANEGCAGAHPGAKCERAFGYTADPGGSGNLPPSFLFAVSIQVTAPITVKRIGFHARAASMGVRMAIYTDQAGAPYTWKASALSGTVAAGRNELGINDPPLSMPVTLPAGTYWIVSSFQAMTQVPQGATTTVRLVSPWSPWNQPFPAMMGPTTSDSVGVVPYYVVGVP